MTTQVDNFLRIATLTGWDTAEEMYDDGPGPTGRLVVAADECRHIAVVGDADTGLIIYTSMKYSDAGGGGRFWRDLKTAKGNHVDLFGTAVGWLMQPMWDNTAHDLSPEKIEAINRTVVWCPDCMTPRDSNGECPCTRWSGTAVWEPQEVES